MGLLDDLFGFIASGNIAGIPTVVIMIIPFIVGLVIGFFTKKMLKIAIIAAIIVIIASYLGFFGLSLGALADVVEQYGPVAFHYAVLLMGMLPLGLGFVVGLILGFLFG
ncbi:hypothetical protein G4O51_06190 [Candidatus Bathyarchaeota archaeon A05DMB-2]|nr:hypothetical protein [Candidatus Bathyarchaeota archaeon A05DMB-2]